MPGFAPLAPRSGAWQGPQFFKQPSFRLVVFNLGDSASLDIWQCWETFLIVTSGWVGFYYHPVEARNAAKHPIVHKTGPHHKELSGLEISSTKIGQPCPSLSVAFLVQEESQ